MAEASLKTSARPVRKKLIQSQRSVPFSDVSSAGRRRGEDLQALEYFKYQLESWKGNGISTPVSHEQR